MEGALLMLPMTATVDEKVITMITLII